MTDLNRYHGTFKRIPDAERLQLDALRGISAIGVAIGHANQFLIGPTTTAGITFFGLVAQGSVMVFFVLSGFLIGKSVCRNIEDNGGDRFSIGRYASDRLWRIYPPLFFAIALMFIIWKIAPAVLPSGTTQFLSYNPNYGRHGINFEWPIVMKTLIFRNGFDGGSPDMNGPLWSLSVEVWYYVIAGGVVALIRRPILLAIFAVVAWRVVGGNDDFTDYAVVWLAGYLLSIAHNRDALNGRAILIGSAVAACLALLFAVLFAYPGLAPSGHSWIRYYNVAIGFTFTFALAAIMGGYVRLPYVMISVFSGSSQYSYTLYLIHVPIFLLIFGAFESYIVGNIAASICVAAFGVAASMGIAFAAASIFENKKLLQSGLSLNKAG